MDQISNPRVASRVSDGPDFEFLNTVNRSRCFPNAGCP